MLKRYFSFAVAVLFASFLLSGCESTTMGGATDASRRQLLTISTESVNDEAATLYHDMLDEARTAKTLNTHVPTTRRVRAIAHRLIDQTGVFRPDAADWGWEINVIKNDLPNAFCAAGGKIVVFSGLVTGLKLTDDELAAVIGHEIAHALREHTREQKSHAFKGALAITAVQLAPQLVAAGRDIRNIDTRNQNLSQITTQVQNIAGRIDTENLSDMALATGLASFIVHQLPFSRIMEEEADVIGMELTARAGYNPQGAVTFWRKMEQLRVQGMGRQDSPLTFLATHPPDDQRIENLEKHMGTLQPIYAEAARRRGAGQRGQSAAPARPGPAKR